MPPTWVRHASDMHGSGMHATRAHGNAPCCAVASKVLAQARCFVACPGSALAARAVDSNVLAPAPTPPLPPPPHSAPPPLPLVSTGPYMPSGFLLPSAANILLPATANMQSASKTEPSNQK